MNKLLYILLYSVFCITSCQPAVAGVGLNVRECDAKYGKPGTVDTHKTEHVRRYYHKKMGIIVYFKEGVAVYIVYRTIDGSMPSLQSVMHDNHELPFDVVDADRSLRESSHPLYAEDWYMSKDNKIIVRVDLKENIVCANDIDYDFINQKRGWVND